MAPAGRPRSRPARSAGPVSWARLQRRDAATGRERLLPAALRHIVSHYSTPGQSGHESRQDRQESSPCCMNRIADTTARPLIGRGLNPRAPAGHCEEAAFLAGAIDSPLWHPWELGGGYVAHLVPGRYGFVPVQRACPAPSSGGSYYHKCQSEQNRSLSPSKERFCGLVAREAARVALLQALRSIP